ncbi:hypothetical protein KFL_006770170 [Klebsormidium nitens]|uniref:Bro-N domain-containing protein n=1 Tax=Klebsormidium nitens TaxID=105231 RepID=A0A1Y1IJ41_KLENI|nr:hypothetical protein KFL_006770170 [Klebsormidium nitens]|eukprot:GAQ90723.1 hypothetical protein KFL_006770170 [Klebsormidium nitens]
MSTVRSSTRSYDNDEKVVQIAHTLGGAQETIFSTERGVYRLLMQSRKPIARPFQKWVAGVIEQIRTRGRYDLEQQVEAAKAELKRQEALARAKIDQLLNEQAELSRKTAKTATEVAKHEVFVNSHRKGDCLVYFGKIREEPDGRVLMKIGSTKDLHERAIGLEKTFGSMLIFQAFPVSLFRQFEEFLQTHPSIAKHVFKEVIHNGRASNREVFLMTPNEVTDAVALAKRHAAAYNDRATVEQIVEYELTKYKTSILEAQAQGLPLPWPDPYFYVPDDRRFTQSRGSKVQRYSPDGKELIRTYSGCAEASRDPDVAKPNAQLIRTASEKRTLYKQFRWAMLDRGLPDTIVQDIGETVESRSNKQGFVAMLDLSENRIVKVFEDMKAAAADRQFKSIGAISTAIKLHRKSGGHYFEMWHDCSEELKLQYLLTNELPNPRKRANGQVVLQSKMCIARASLKRAIQTGSIVKGHLWHLEE